MAERRGAPRGRGDAGRGVGGDDDDAGSDDASTAAEDADPNGVLRMAYDMAPNGGLHFDLDTMGSAAYGPLMNPVYDTLLHRQPDDS
jgi:hypothetical protein